jgi:hypothetical protein
LFEQLEEEPASHEQDELENTSDNPENDQKEALGSGKNTSRINKEPGLPGLAGQSYSIEEVIDRSITNEQGNSKGYFTINEWKTTLMCLPTQHPLHCDEDQAIQVLHALVQEGKIIEFEQGKYRPTTEGKSYLAAEELLKRL